MVKAGTVARGTLVAEDRKTKPLRVQDVSQCNKRQYLHWAVQGKAGISYWCVHKDSEWVTSR